MADWYVRMSGDDLDTGADWAHAFATWQQAFDSASGGDTVYIADGIYNEAVSKNMGNVVFTVIGVGRPILDGAGLGASQLLDWNSGHLFVNNVWFRNHPWGSVTIDAAYQVARISLDNCWVTDCGYVNLNNRDKKSHPDNDGYVKNCIFVNANIDYRSFWPKYGSFLFQNNIFTGSCPYVKVSTDGGSASAEVKNNIYHSVDVKYGGLAALSSDFNDYYDADIYDSDTSTNYTSLAEWQADHFGQDVNSIDDNPMMIDPANGNYVLQPGSPCFHAGEGGVSIGCYGVGSQLDPSTDGYALDNVSVVSGHFELTNPANPGTVTFDVIDDGEIHDIADMRIYWSGSEVYPTHVFDVDTADVPNLRQIEFRYSTTSFTRDQAEPPNWIEISQNQTVGDAVGSTPVNARYRQVRVTLRANGVNS